MSSEKKRRSGSAEKRRYNRAVKILTVMTATLLALANVTAIALSDILGGINYLSAQEMVVSGDLNDVTLDDEQTVFSSATDTIAEHEMEKIDKEIAEAKIDENGLRHQDGVTNILLIGTDGWRRNSKKTRSDVNIILSINDKTKQITMTSVMRDTYVSIPGRKGNDKINAAHAYGGIALSKATVENAFGIRIDHVAEVNYFTFIDIVEAVGGVKVERIRGAEVSHINKTVNIVNRFFGYDHIFEYIHGAGKDVTLNGAQALGYVRIREVGNGDYERTSRQREVLSSVIDKVKSSDFRMATRVVTAVAQNVTTDFSEGELAQLALKASDYSDYTVVSQRIPFEGTYWGGMYKGIWILKIDFDKNREMLYRSVFDGKDAYGGSGVEGPVE